MSVKHAGTGQETVWKDVQIPSIYSNVMSVGTTPYDISLTFGEIDSATQSQINVTPRVKLNLSPEQALNLSRLLAVVVEKFVEGNGPLRTVNALDVVEMKRRLEQNTIKAPNESK
jgi:hypothetical protein